MEQWDLVEVEWMDSCAGDTGWHKPKKKEVEIDGCVTVGQVYAVSADRIVVALSRDTTLNHVDGIITIPTISITKFTRLERKRAPR